MYQEDAPTKNKESQLRLFLSDSYDDETMDLADKIVLTKSDGASSAIQVGL